MESARPDRESEETVRVRAFPHGTLLTDFEVPFSYKEQGERKTELVKLCLCIRCAPLLFVSKGEKQPYLAACQARQDVAFSAVKKEEETAKEQSPTKRRKP